MTETTKTMSDIEHAAIQMANVLKMLSKRQIATWYERPAENGGGYYAGWDDAEYFVKRALHQWEQVNGRI